MKHHVVEPIAKSPTCESMKPQRPEKLKTFMEDPVAEDLDMSSEQQEAFVSPEHEDRRVLRSHGDQGRT